jgi:signal peptidase I
MSGTQVPTRFRGLTVAVRVRPATPLTRYPRVGRQFRAVVEVALIAALALSVFIGAGIVGNPWYRMVTIEGGSMAPTILRGDLIVVRPAPSKVEPGMILVMTVGGEVVTHRVVAVNADGTFVTRGDANSVNDAWGSQQIEVDGLYVTTIPWLGHILPVGNASEASFADGTSAGMRITVGSWPTPTPTPVAATVRIEPETISLGDEGDISVFIDEFGGDHHLSEIDLTSVTLCYKDACIVSHGKAKLDGNGHVAAKFDRAALAGLVGPDQGDLTLVVQGTLTGGGTFSGQHTNRVTGGHDSLLPPPPPAAGLAPAATPTPTDTPAATPTPAAGLAPAATPTPLDTPVPTPTPTPTDTPVPTPTDTPVPTP